MRKSTKYGIIAALFFGLAIATAAYAAVPAVTVGGHYACFSEEWHDDIITFAVAKDRGSVDAYLKSQKCIVLAGGISVIITDVGWTVHEFTYQGIKLWVAREGLKTK